MRHRVLGPQERPTPRVCNRGSATPWFVMPSGRWECGASGSPTQTAMRLVAALLKNLVFLLRVFRGVRTYFQVAGTRTGIAMRDSTSLVCPTWRCSGRAKREDNGSDQAPAKIGFVSGLGNPQLVQTGQSLIHVHSMSRSPIMRLGVTEIGACGFCLRAVSSENRRLRIRAYSMEPPTHRTTCLPG